MTTTKLDAPQNLQFNREQVTFLRTMGHELRSPLNSILATAEMMTNAVYGELQPPQSKAAQRILRNSYRLLELISAVMLYIRAQANAMEMTSVPIPLGTLLNEQIPRHQQRAADKGLTIDLQVQPDTPETVQGDPDQIAFIVNELLKNAISFTAAGSVRAQVSTVDPDHWTLAIADTGTGIEPGNLPFVFEPFWRGQEAKQITPDGNGLGLTIVREFVRLMNGHIDIESQPGKGTTLKVTFPNVIPAHLTGASSLPPESA